MAVLGRVGEIPRRAGDVGRIISEPRADTDWHSPRSIATDLREDVVAERAARSNDLATAYPHVERLLAGHPHLWGTNAIVAAWAARHGACSVTARGGIQAAARCRRPSPGRARTRRPRSATWTTGSGASRSPTGHEWTSYAVGAASTSSLTETATPTLAATPAYLTVPQITCFLLYLEAPPGELDLLAADAAALLGSLELLDP